MPTIGKLVNWLRLPDPNQFLSSFSVEALQRVWRTLRRWAHTMVQRSDLSRQSAGSDTGILTRTFSEKIKEESS